MRKVRPDGPDRLDAQPGKGLYGKYLGSPAAARKGVATPWKQRILPTARLAMARPAMPAPPNDRFIERISHPEVRRRPPLLRLAFHPMSLVSIPANPVLEGAVSG